ncbi:MAG TPA: SH3 domain-containing protein [Nannocystaceae bacterium]|nr:SH3 domain-containing protein [Nannocystaceae bacterium]
MIRARSIPCIGVVLLALACGKSETLTVAPTEAAAPELIPSPQLQEWQYKKILLLPPPEAVDRSKIGKGAPAQKDANYYVGKLEKAMLEQGFAVISPEIVARAEKTLGSRGASMSAVEKAMVLGRETQSEAVMVLQSVSVAAGEAFYDVDKMKVVPVESGKAKQHTKKRQIRKKGLWYHSETEECLVRVPLYEVRVEIKLIDSSSGGVLWVGSGRETVLDALATSWVAKLDKRCRVSDENYDYDELLADEATLATTVGALYARLLAPMKKDAFAGKPIVVAEKKPVEKPPEPAPKKSIAIVSGDKAALRMGPHKKDRRIRYVPRKAEVEIVETMGEWSKVKLQDGTTGWMHDSTFIIPK